MTTLPLHGVRVLDLVNGRGESCGRYLADLGAEVIRVEPPGGASSRHDAPFHQGVSLPFAVRNANKLGVALDLDDPAGRQQLLELISTVDILLESFPVGWMAARGLGQPELASRNRKLVFVSITDFGQSGPYRDWVATDEVLYALGGVLARSGLPGAEPLLPPTGLVERTTAVNAAWAALVAFFNRLRTGIGEYVDVSAFEAVVHGFDPGFGTQGSAAAGRSDDYPRGRPDARNFYPVFPCRDGHVRICLLAKRQWRAMFAWLDEPAAFADPKFDSIGARFKAADTLHPLIQDLFSRFTRDELVGEGALRGVPVGGVLSTTEVIDTEHFNVSGTFVEADVARGVRGKVPSGYVQFGGERVGLRHRAPDVGEHNGLVLSGGTGLTPPTSRSLPGFKPDQSRAPGSRPLEGVRVLDLGVIVYGAELGRLFADQGADVIKVENSSFPDGLRQSRRGSELAASFAWGNRNKRGLGLDLRTRQGLSIFRKLVAQADVVLANFKPGTLESLGLSYVELSAINPRIIVSDSSAFGSNGPWSTRMGYGPLVRASCGVSTLWRYPDSEDAFCDGSTVYPDHVAANVTAVAVLAALIGRLRTEYGALIETSQADVAIMQLGDRFLAESLLPGSVTAQGNVSPDEAPTGVYACAGDDEWCVVWVRDDVDWARLCSVVGRPELVDDPDLSSTEARLRNRSRADRVVSEWIASYAPVDAMRRLQEGGVPAGAMLRLPDQLTDPHLANRRSFMTLEHDQLPASLPTSARPAQFSSLPDSPLEQAPLPGEHTREICTTLLGMTAEEVDSLLAEGVLQAPLAPAAAS